MAVISFGALWVSPALANGNRDPDNDYPLDPGPTYVEYGNRVIHNMVQTEGKLIKQWTRKNPGSREWVWEGYDLLVPRYRTLYNKLYSLQEHILVENGESPYVWILDEVSGDWGNYLEEAPGVEAGYQPVWIRCRVLMVDREARKRGGIPTYEKTTMTFTIDDPNYQVL